MEGTHKMQGKEELETDRAALALALEVMDQLMELLQRWVIQVGHHQPLPAEKHHLLQGMHHHRKENGIK